MTSILQPRIERRTYQIRVLTNELRRSFLIILFPFGEVLLHEAKLVNNFIVFYETRTR